MDRRVRLRVALNLEARPNPLEADCMKFQPFSLEESLSITTGRCDLAIATHARKMHKNISI